MCYFVEINLSRKELEKHYGIPMPEDPRYTPGFFHSAFTKPFLPVITNQTPELISIYSWGLIPAWVKDKQSADKLLQGTYNSRAETIWEKPSFRQSARHKRCLVPVHGFFEWNTDGKIKTPYYIKRKDDKPFSFAGLYENWTDPESGEIHNTFSIITTVANPLMEKIHNLKKRMPAILQAEEEMQWIGNKLSEHELSGLLKPFPEGELIAWPVSKEKFLHNQDITDATIIEPA